MGKRPPFVSIIIPSHNGISVLPACMDALLHQTFSDFDIVVGLNLTNDGSEEYLKSKKTLDIKIVREDSIASSYAARNRALEQARGEILAFIDDDCVPRADWLERGLVALECEDMVAGKIILTGGDPMNLWERLDAKIHVNQRLYVEKGRSAGGNLLIKREVYEKTGPFPTGLISGGDGMWSKMATDKGFSIVYAPDCIVDHPTKNTFSSLARKRFRIGIGLYQTGDMNFRIFLSKLWKKINIFKKDQIENGYVEESRKMTPVEKTVSLLLWIPLLYGNFLAPVFIRRFKQKRL